MTKTCSECKAGEIKEPATYRVTLRNPEHHNLVISKLVCDEHLQMLKDEYNAEDLASSPLAQSAPIKG